MYKVYYSHLENAHEDDNDSLSSSFWTDMVERYVEDGRIETELGLCQQDVNKEEEWYVKDHLNEQIGERLQEGDECKNKDEQYYVEKQSDDDEDVSERSGKQVSQQDEGSVKTPGDEDGGSDGYIKEGCAGEQISDRELHVIKNLGSGHEEGQSKVEENSEEEQSMYFANDMSMYLSLEEESERDDLESEEEIEYFANQFSEREIKCDEPEGEKLERDKEWETSFVNQDVLSELVMNNEQMCTGGQMYEKEQHPERRISFMAEQLSISNDQHVVSLNVDVDDANTSDQIFTKHGEKSGSAELQEHGAHAEDYHGSVSSLTTSIITSGYGTYKPDSPKDDLDARDDRSLFESELDVEYPDACYTQDDSGLSWYRDWLSSGVLEQQIPSGSLNADDWTAFDSLTINHAGTVRDTPDENRLRSTCVRSEDSRTLSLSVVSEEKASDGVRLQVTRTSDRNVSFCTEDLNDAEMLHKCNNDPFNIRPNDRATTVTRQTEDGLARRDFRKMKQVKLHRFRRG